MVLPTDHVGLLASINKRPPASVVLLGLVASETAFAPVTDLVDLVLKEPLRDGADHQAGTRRGVSVNHSAPRQHAENAKALPCGPPPALSELYQQFCDVILSRLESVENRRSAPFDNVLPLALNMCRRCMRTVAEKPADFRFHRLPPG